MLRMYVRLWLLLAVMLAGECFMLNFFPRHGLIGTLQAFGFFPHMSLNPETGKSISLFLGWAGFALMCLSNVYSVRKRLLGAKGGNVSRWLDFHIFCGLLGPTLILFHTNFKIGGLVAISFWSMVVSFTSGIVGRYFYLQLASHKGELDRLALTYAQRFENCVGLSKAEAARLQESAGRMAGVPVSQESTGIFRSLWLTAKGDLRLRFSFPGLTAGLPTGAADWLEKAVLARRRSAFLEHFRRWMGYWHSFHMPFAVFMYAVAVIHIATALLLGVGEIS